MKIGMIGCGAYSLAISLMLQKNNNDITIWSESQNKIDTIKKTGQLNACLPRVKLSEELKFTTSLQETCLNKDVIFVIVAAQYMADTMNNIKAFVNSDTVICIGSKGIEQDSFKFMHEIVEEIIKLKNLVVLSGPGFAIDVAHNEPVGLSIASKSKLALNIIKKVLGSDTIKLRESNDIMGIEICGCIKNVVAMAAGIIDGLGYKESTQAFLITESIHDIKKFIKSFNADSKSVLSFAGIGDLILTCTSTKSRNFSYGRLLGSSSSVKELNNFLIENTVEGYYTLKSLTHLLNKHNIESDFLSIMFDIVFNKEDPDTLINFLITKE